MRFSSITLAPAAASTVDAAIPLRSADIALQNAIKLRTAAPQMSVILQLQNRISTPKRKNDFEARLKKNFERKIINAKMKKSSLQCSSSTAQSVSTHAKHNSTAPSKKRKKSPETIGSTARAVREHFTAKQRRLKPSRKRAYFSPQRKLRLTRKATMFRANPNIQIASMIHVIHENEAFVRGVLRIPPVKCMKMKLSCEASFEFQEIKK